MSKPAEANHRIARVVLIGAGHMGKIRAKAINANERFVLCGVCDTDVDTAKALANRYKVRDHDVVIALRYLDVYSSFTDLHAPLFVD